MFASTAGNVLEWYDFAVFGYFSDILGLVFFPVEDEQQSISSSPPTSTSHINLIKSLAVFGGAFVMRPLGGILVGHIGDVYGRKLALEVSVFSMAMATFSMGCLPTYEMIGPTSYRLLIIIRLIQGLSVGGQLMSSAIYTLESQPTKDHWGLIGSYVMAAANFGTLLGGVVAYMLRQSLSIDELLAWGWRLPFWSGILIGFCGLYLKFFGDEVSLDGNDIITHDEPTTETTTPTTIAAVVMTTTTTKIAPREDIPPWRLALAKENRRALLAACMVPMLFAGGIYLCFVWLSVYMESLIPHPYSSQAFGISSLAMLISICILFPFAGALSDKIGRKTVMTLGGLSFGTVSPLMIMLIGSGMLSPALACTCQTIIGICLSLWGAPMIAWLAESFPPNPLPAETCHSNNDSENVHNNNGSDEVVTVNGATIAAAATTTTPPHPPRHHRLTSMSIGYNIGMGIAGGLSPVLATYVLDRYGHKAPGFLLTILASISLIGLWFVAPSSSSSSSLLSNHNKNTDQSINVNNSEKMIIDPEQKPLLSNSPKEQM